MAWLALKKFGGYAWPVLSNIETGFTEIFVGGQEMVTPLRIGFEGLGTESFCGWKP